MFQYWPDEHTDKSINVYMMLRPNSNLMLNGESRPSLRTKIRLETDYCACCKSLKKAFIGVWTLQNIRGLNVYKLAYELPGYICLCLIPVVELYFIPSTKNSLLETGVLLDGQKVGRDEKN